MIGTPIRKLLHVLYVFVAAHHVLDVLYVSEGVRLDVIVLLQHLLDVLYVVGVRLDVLYVVGVRLDVVVLQLDVLDVLYVSVRVALDVYLFFGSLAILILHSVLLSHHGVPINVQKTA